MSRGSPSAGSSPGLSVGVVSATGAYLWWGLVTPLYYKELEQVQPLDLVAWRVLAGLPILLVLVALPPGIGRLRAAFHRRRAVFVHAASTVMLLCNWVTFIYAIQVGRLTEASLGYFLNPLVSVLLGRIVLGEMLSRRQAQALCLAALGVVVFGAGNFAEMESHHPLAGVPWISLLLATSFGLYGLLRKEMQADSVTGLTIEMLFMFPALLGLELFLAAQDKAAFGNVSLRIDLLLLVGGLVTVVPLLFFGGAARRLQLSTLGMLQYLSPTCQFLLAVVFLGEPFTASRGVAFFLIWLAIALYLSESLGRRGQKASA